MAPEVVVGLMMVASLVIYALTGGADFGGGVWDLAASRGPRGEKERETIAHAIAPIWEANHVWLILIIVLLFVCFPRAFAAVTTALHIPLLVMLVGIVLRGSAFVFRAYGPQSDEAARRWGVTFAIASVLTPYALGVTLGAVTSGMLHIDPATGRVRTDFVSEWLSAFPLLLGLYVVALFALLAAVYLLHETDDEELLESFRKRALVAGVTVGVLAFASLVVARFDAPQLYVDLTSSSWALPFHAATGAAAVTTLWALWRRRYHIARIAVAAQVTCVTLGMVLSQAPFIVPPDLTVEIAAAPDNILWLTVIIVGTGSVVLVPSIYVLYSVFKRPAR